MTTNTKIEWTDVTWNPVRGCSVISPGCHNCYAMKQAHRFSGDGKPYAGLTKQTRSGPQWTGEIALIENVLTDPLHWRDPKRVFVNSMSDLFHEGVPYEFIDKVFAVMALASGHTFQVLTKRPGLMRAYLESRAKTADYWKAAARQIGWTLEFAGVSMVRFPLPNVWLGVSVENQKHADERIPLLLQTHAAVRFISAEPLLGPIDLLGLRGGTFDAMTGCGDRERLTEWEDTPSLDWVIVGGESGNSARPFAIEWARSLMQQCQRAGTAFFLKQLGAMVSTDNVDDVADLWGHLDEVDPGTIALPVQRSLRDRKGGDITEWPTDLRVREFPAVANA